MSADVSSNTFVLSDAGIDFLPSEVMKTDKTAGWLGADFNKINKVWPWIWRNVDPISRQKFNTLEVDATKYTSKMCTAYLKLCNQPIPANINEKRSAVMNHKKNA